MNNAMNKQNQGSKRPEDSLQQLKNDYLEQQMSAGQVKKLRERMKQAKRDNAKQRGNTGIRSIAAAAAAVTVLFIALPNTSPNVAYAMEQLPVIGRLVEVVTIRDYQYETDRNKADIETPHIAVDGDSSEKMALTVDEINQEIDRITAELTAEFEANLSEQGYQDVMVKGEVLATTQDYFTLKLICYQGAGSGYEWNNYYTIDLATGERLQLNSLFKDGADYITPISDNIKEQMQTQMANDDTVTYWLDSDVEEWNFKAITEDTSFYLNENDNVVIGFDEGEVAPMYMGTVEFEIPADVLNDIRK